MHELSIMFDEVLVPSEIDLFIEYDEYDSCVHYRPYFRFRTWTQLQPLQIMIYEFLSPFYIHPMTLMVTEWTNHSMVFRLLDIPPHHGHLHRIEEKPFIEAVRALLEPPNDYCETPCGVYYLRAIDIMGRFWLLHSFGDTPCMSDNLLAR
jgi:hypothetical protein